MTGKIVKIKIKIKIGVSRLDGSAQDVNFKC